MARKTRPKPKNVPATTSQGGGQIANNDAPSTKEFVTALNARRRAFQEILPDTFTPERFVALCLQSFRANPALGRCSIDSVLKAAFQCAKLALEPDTPAQLCYLIPYKYEATFVLGYQGAKVLAARDGRVAKIWAEHRHERDHWRLVRGTNSRIEHEPADGDRGEYMGTYAVVEYTDPRVRPSFEYVDALDMLRVEAHSHGCDVSKVGSLHLKAETDWKLSSKPWFKWRDRMRLKTAIKRVCKQVIAFDEVGHQLRAAFRLDDLAESGKSQATLLDQDWNTAGRVRQEKATDVVGEVLSVEVPPEEPAGALETTAKEKAIEPAKDDEPPELEGKEREEAIDKFAALATETTKKYPDLAQKVGQIAVLPQSPDVKFGLLEKAVAEHESRLQGVLTPEEEAEMAGGAP